MNNRGITLIELMIVVAILGIAFNFKGIYTITRDYKAQEKRIEEQEKILRFQKILRKLLKESKSFTKVTYKQVVADNFKLMTSNNNDKIFLNGKVYQFDNFKLVNFERIDEIVKCDVINGNFSFNMFLVPGKIESPISELFKNTTFEVVEQEADVPSDADAEEEAEESDDESEDGEEDGEEEADDESEDAEEEVENE